MTIVYQFLMKNRSKIDMFCLNRKPYPKLFYQHLFADVWPQKYYFLVCVLGIIWKLRTALQIQKSQQIIWPSLPYSLNCFLVSPVFCYPNTPNGKIQISLQARILCHVKMSHSWVRSTNKTHRVLNFTILIVFIQKWVFSTQLFEFTTAPPFKYTSPAVLFGKSYAKALPIRYRTIRTTITVNPLTNHRTIKSTMRTTRQLELPDPLNNKPPSFTTHTYLNLEGGAKERFVMHHFIPYKWIHNSTEFSSI